MPKISEEKRQARRLQILDAASRCFARDGFHATSMADIEQDMRNSEVQPQDLPNGWGAQPEGQHVWQAGSIQLYGGDYSIGGGTYYNVARMVPPTAGGIYVLQPGYWYNGPPVVARY